MKFVNVATVVVIALTLFGGCTKIIEDNEVYYTEGDDGTEVSWTEIGGDFDMESPYSFSNWEPGFIYRPYESEYITYDGSYPKLKDSDSTLHWTVEIKEGRAYGITDTLVVSKNYGWAGGPVSSRDLSCIDSIPKKKIKK